ncbi:MAG: flagellar hook-length control protein FliK [Candidatus Poseidoniia archaeon]|nr:flagellar hook-length control protein FliK [Candidatus Poseidoniia archaeon]
MSNIIQSSSLPNLADGTSENPVDLSKSEETQQGIDFKDIYVNITNENNRKSPPDHQIPKDGFQKDLETISDPKKADSGKVEQKIPQVQQPFGKILPTLVAHQRGLSFEKAILTAPVSAVSEYSLKEFIKRQNTVDEVIDRGRSTAIEKDEFPLRGIRSEEMGLFSPDKNLRAEIDFSVSRKSLDQKQTVDTLGFAHSKPQSFGDTELIQKRHQSTGILTSLSPSTTGKQGASSAKLAQQPEHPESVLGGVDKDHRYHLLDEQLAPSAKSVFVNDPVLAVGQSSASDKPVPAMGQSAASDKPVPAMGQSSASDKPVPAMGQSSASDKPVPAMGQSASWLSLSSTLHGEEHSGSSILSRTGESSVLANEVNSSREEMGLKSEQSPSRDYYSERKPFGPQLMVSKGEPTRTDLISSGTEKPLEEQQMLKSSLLSREVLSSSSAEKVFKGKEYSDGVNLKQEMAVEALARNLRIMSSSGQQSSNLMGYQGQKYSLSGSYEISKRLNGSSLDSPDKFNVQNVESRVEFRSLLREMQHPSQMQGTSDRSLQYEGLAQRFGELMANRIIAGVQQNNWSLNIKLSPASLGEIGVTIAYDEGGLEGKILAAEDTTRQLLQDSLPRLRSVLKEMLENHQMVNVNVDSNSDLRQDTREKPDNENDVTVELVMDILDEATENVEGRGLGIGNLNIYV